MVVVRVEGKANPIRDDAKAKTYLASIGIDYERWDTSHALPEDAGEYQILEAYRSEIERLKEKGRYLTADVINLNEKTPGIDEMLSKFNKEHWHDEDEVRFTISGHGVFHVNTGSGRITSIEVSRGDLIRIPSRTYHWFDLCEDREIRAIRLFQNRTGWTPYYTGSGEDQKHQPLCMGPAYFPLRS